MTYAYDLSQIVLKLIKNCSPCIPPSFHVTWLPLNPEATIPNGGSVLFCKL